MYTGGMKRILLAVVAVVGLAVSAWAGEKGNVYLDSEHGVAFVVPPGFITGKFEINSPGDWPFQEMIVLIEPRLLRKKASPDFIPPAYGFSCITVRMRPYDARELFGYRDVPESEKVGENRDYFIYRHADDKGRSFTDSHFYLVAKEGTSYVLVDSHVRAEDGVNVASYVETLWKIAQSVRRVEVG